MIAFLLMGRESGSLDFASFRTLSLSPGLASAVFLLAFFGFGAKAGMMPLHSWLPRAHPAAPSHASALMSGVMVKIGIFGILKVAMDLLAQTGLPLWWGILVMAIGAISALLGVLYALAEQDIKRLLAWSTVENVGIILLAVGVAMVGLSLHDPLLTVVGLLGALFHLLNHALFKGLLFLGAGAIISRLHTHDMEKMGALAKRMPWTAAACLIGCLAISAIPPLNGFISEWYTWQSLFSLSRVEAVALQLAGPIAMVMLAVTGAVVVDEITQRRPHAAAASRHCLTGPSHFPSRSRMPRHLLCDETLRGANDTTASKGQAAKASPVVTATVMRG